VIFNGILSNQFFGIKVWSQWTFCTAVSFQETLQIPNAMTIFFSAASEPNWHSSQHD